MLGLDRKIRDHSNPIETPSYLCPLKIINRANISEIIAIARIDNNKYLSKNFLFFSIVVYVLFVLLIE